MQQSRVSYDGHKRVSRKLEQQWAAVGAGWGRLEKVKVGAATQRKHRAQQEIRKKEKKNMQENKRKFDAGDVLQNQIEKQKRRRKSE